MLGAGGGFAPYARLRSSNQPDYELPVDETGSGLAWQLVIGYAWDERNWLVYEGNVLSRHSDAYDTEFYQGMNGVSWYHAYGPRRQWITAAGAGLQIVDTGSYFHIYINTRAPAGPPTEDGFGVLLGAGYEFHPRVLAMMYGTTGTTKAREVRFRQSNLSLMLQYLWD